ncbi:Porin superfamily protein [Candidatus Hepatincola sp. Pdp]
MRSIKSKLLGIIYILLLTCTDAYPMSLFEGRQSGLDLMIDARGFYSDTDFGYYTDGSLFYHYDLSNDWSLAYLISAMYDSSYDSNVYKSLGENYLSIDNYYLGTLDIGTTPTVYYNGFLAGWLDWGFTRGYEIIDSNRYSDYFALKNASRSLFYTYQLHNMKIAVQFSGNDNEEYENSPIGGNRKYGIGSGFVYALGPLSFSTSYLVSDYDRTSSLSKIIDDKSGFSTMQVLNAGFKFQYAGIYSVLGLFYDKNRWTLGNESIALNYLLRYDNNKKQKWVPQIMYGVREYVTTGYTDTQQSNADRNMISDNFIYLSLSYYFNYHFSIYAENKIDIRSSKQINNAKDYGIASKDERDNMVGIGLSYELF